MVIRGGEARWGLGGAAVRGGVAWVGPRWGRGVAAVGQGWAGVDRRGGAAWTGVW